MAHTVALSPVSVQPRTYSRQREGVEIDPALIG